MKSIQINIKTTLISYLTFYLTFSPLLAYGAPLQVDGSTQTSLDNARNGVPIVNIANPNGSGLSHNKFTHYNVNSEGLILNNASSSTVNTQLGGHIYGNEHLTNSATIILNEVTSTNRSTLSGYTEIAGQKSDLVIANPNGLTINGAGFINTANLTLTTGTPNIANGSLDSLSINGGDILIEGAGLDVNTQNSARIYTHYLKLNGKINANNLDIKLGKNFIDDNHDIRSSTNSGKTANLLLDTSALGGMYANRITLVGTDQGLGVNLPPEVLASTEGITINNNGRIVLQNINAKDTVNITSTENIEVNNNLYSQTNATLNADNRVLVKNGTVAANDYININANELDNQARIVAGLNEDGTQNNSGILNINATNTVNSGDIQSTNNIILTTNNLTNTNNILANNDLTITANNSLTNSGSIHANNDNTVTTTILTNTRDITASNRLIITANEISTTNGEISAKNTNIAADNLTSTNTNILAVENVDLQIASLLTNNGLIQANKDLTLNASNLINQKLIVANNATLVAINVQNTDTIHGYAALSLSGADLDNDNQLSSDGSLVINVTNALDNASAQIVALGDSNITAKTLDNSAGKILTDANHVINIAQTLDNNNGLIQSQQNLHLQANHLNNNNAKIQSKQALTLSSKTIDLSGSTLYGTTGLTLTLDALNNIASSNIGSGGGLAITATDYISNNADLLANGELTLVTQGSLTNYKTISSGNTLHITAGSLTNNATISAGTGDSDITISGNITNQSRISAQDNLAISGGNISNNGFFNAGLDLTVKSNNLTNNETLFAGRDMYLYTQNMLSNTEGSNVFAFNNLLMSADVANNKTDTIINDKATIQSYQGDIDIYANNLINRGEQKTNGVITHVTSDVFYNYQTTLDENRIGSNTVTDGSRGWYWVLFPEYGYAVYLKRPWLTSQGVRVAVDSDLYSDIPITAQAKIYSGRNLNINANYIENTISEISSSNDMVINAGALDNNSINPDGSITFSNVNSSGGNNFIYTYEQYENKTVDNYMDSINVPDYLAASQTGVHNYLIDQDIPGLSAVIQAGGSITGSISSLSNVNVSESANIGVSTQPQTQTTSTQSNTQSISDQTIDAGTTPTQVPMVEIVLPTNNYGLFVQAQDPQSSYLIETNPEFTLQANFISSDYLLNRIGFSPDQTMKRVGDGFYEQNLVRQSLVNQTGRRFLSADITTDNAQYQQLMDNALEAQQSLGLAPGISLSVEQIALLQMDIVWLEEQTVAGQQVLVPRVYIANADQYKVEGGKIIAGKDIDLKVDRLISAGLLQAGGSAYIAAADSITNQGGAIQAKQSISLLAINDVKNISGTIKAKDINLKSGEGNIVNARNQKDFNVNGRNYDLSTSLTGRAGQIIASNTLNIDATKTVTVQGSNLKAISIDIKANKVDVITTEHKNDFFVGSASKYTKEQSTTNLVSNIEGTNVAINSSGITTIKGSNVSANDSLNIKAAEIDILAVNDSSYAESKSSSKGLLSKKSTTTKKATSTNIATNLSGGNITLTTTTDGIDIIGSSLSAKEGLALDSAGDLNIQAGYDGTMDESHTKKSGWFSGGAIFSKSEDLEGKITKTAALSNLSGGDITLKAKNDMQLTGVDLIATESLSANAQDIRIENATNEEKTYSTHSRMTVGLDDIVNTLTNPGKLIQKKDGKVSITLATAQYSNADQTTTKTTVVSSNLQAKNLSLNANSEVKESGESGESGKSGNIDITGSNLIASEGLNLSASNDVTIKDAKDTEKSTSKEQEGTAELKLTVKNEYVQIKYAVDDAKAAQAQLKQSKQSYDQYKKDLATQDDNLAQLKQDLKNGKTGIEQADIEELQSYIDDLKQEDAFYKANIVLATANLATKTTAVASQMATAAASSTTYGFNVGLELDIDVFEEQFEAYKEQSVASNLSAGNISIRAGNTTTVQGSNLNAGDQITIDSEDLNIFAATDVNTSQDSSEHKNLNISYTVYGVGSGSGGASASVDRSNGSSDSITQQNSQLSANNIHINTGETTTIAGANIAANDSLNLKTKNLNVASVQDSQRERSSSQGASISGSFGGGKGGSSDGGTSSATGTSAASSVNSGSIRNGISRSSSKETVLTTLIGNSVNIEVIEDTAIRGATIAAVDAEGNDTGNLTLKTDTLEVSSLNNTRDSKSSSLDVGVGSTVSLDYANDNSHSKTKTLGTIGEGNVQVANLDDSNTTLLNRDITDNEVDIYDIESHQGLKGSLDTRMLTEDGREEIKKEFEEFGKNMQTVAKGLPEANNGNAIIAAIGKGLDTLSEYTGGIIPSNGLNGGLLGNIPVMMGDNDINHKVIQVATKDSKYVLENPDLFIPITESAYYQSASEENQFALRGKGLYVSREPVSIDEDNATYQNFTNGMLNTEGDAIKNGMDQAGSGIFTVNYNPTHGLFGDGLESAVDKAGGTTGIAKQTGEFVKDVTEARAARGSNFPNHSQGNLLMKSGIEYINENGGFRDREYYLDSNATTKEKREAGIPTFSSFGSPVNTAEMKMTVDGVGFIYTGSSTKNGDAVGEVLGGNKGNDGEMETIDRIKGVVNVIDLFNSPELNEDGSLAQNTDGSVKDPGSPHSTYECGVINSSDRCGDRP